MSDEVDLDDLWHVTDNEEPYPLCERCGELPAPYLYSYAMYSEHTWDSDNICGECLGALGDEGGHRWT